MCEFGSVFATIRLRAAAASRQVIADPDARLPSIDPDTSIASRRRLPVGTTDRNAE